MDQTHLTEALKSTPVTATHAFETIGSTNDEALAWADEGASDYSLVISDEQTKGRGRFNRRWVTRPGSSLAFSLILKPTPNEIEHLSLFAPLCGLAVHDAVQSLFDIDPQIKWPNDILIERQKCCGILVEANWTDGRPNAVVLGIGINITRESVPPADGQLFSAACLEDFVQAPVDRFLVLQKVLLEIQKWRALFATPLFFDHWTKHLAFLGEQVMIVQSEKQSIIGVEKGIDQHGNLVLLLENNQEMAFEVGDVHLRPLNASNESGGNHA
jgi:BirA family transcriptional regulator, biotin operon repressor / biotin---[acetyl-CoA-carboxylase] ligase